MYIQLYMHTYTHTRIHRPTDIHAYTGACSLETAYIWPHYAMSIVGRHICKKRGGSNSCEGRPIV